MDLNVRPMPGTLWCNKNSKPRVSVHVDGLGEIEVEGVSEGGLILPFTDNRGDINVKTTLVVVERVGRDEPWVVDKIDYKTTFAEQGLSPGVVIATRAGAGLDQRRTDDFINIRFNEIACIGNTEDDGPPMYPAPGWVLCRVLSGKAGGSLIIDERHQDVLEHAKVVRMQVVALPRGAYPSDMAEGDIVYMPRYQSPDFVEFENNTYRCVMQADVIAIEVTNG